MTSPGEKGRRPQVSANLPSERMRAQANEIARQLDERDIYGRGLNVVIRRCLENYVKRHRDLLPDDLRD